MTRIAFRTCLTVVVVVAWAAAGGVARADVVAGEDQLTIDGARLAVGTPVEVSGPALDADRFELSRASGFLSGVRVGGRANQDGVTFELHAGEGGVAADALRVLKRGQWYKVRGRVVDWAAGGARTAVGVTVDACEAVPAAPAVVADFEGRGARLAGVAERGGGLRVVGGGVGGGGGGVVVRVDGVTDWPARAVGKAVEVTGTVVRDAAGAAGAWRVTGATWRLIELADQVGGDVALDGTFRSLNGVWWFDYRGTRVCVTDARTGRPVTLASESHGRRARVSGGLVLQLRPSLEQISLKQDRDLVPTYTVRRAAVEFVAPPITYSSRFRQVFATPVRVVDGVPDLVAERPLHRNIIGDETRARDYRERNADAITGILRASTPATLDVLARRAGDPARDRPMRLLYAALLAAANDPRGRAALTEGVGDPEGPEFDDALYCLGAVGTLAPPDARSKTDLAWAGPVMVGLMTARDAAGKYTTAERAVRYSSIPEALLRIGTPAARRALIGFAASGQEGASSLLRQLLEDDDGLTAAELAPLERAASGPYVRRALLARYLRLGEVAAVGRFLPELADGGVYLDLRDALSPALATALRGHLAALTGEARDHAAMLILLTERDPVPRILALLDDPKWADKNLALYELARLKDGRAVAPVAAKLRTAAPNYFGTDSTLEAAVAVGHGVEAVANPATDESIGALIDLFGVDLARFGTYIDADGWRRIVAAHLIDLTGESFGTDAAAWRRWHQGRRAAPGPR